MRGVLFRNSPFEKGKSAFCQAVSSRMFQMDVCLKVRNLRCDSEDLECLEYPDGMVRSKSIRRGDVLDSMQHRR